MLSRPTVCALALFFAACQTGVGSPQDGSTQPTTNQPGPVGNPGPTNPGTQPSISNMPSASPNNPVAQPIPSDPNRPTTAASVDANGMVFLGRVAAARPFLTWSGTGVTAAFTGTQAAFTFRNVNGNNWVNVRVDNGAPSRVAVNSNQPISSGRLANGAHTFTVTKANEPALGVLQFGGMTVAGTVTPATLPARRIEFIGDSITVGYGVEGASPCSNSAALENNEKTYAALTANALNAAYDLIAWSGRGLMRNAATTGTDTSPIMPALWAQLSATDATTPYDFPAARAPQAVVINLGTNDFTYIAYDSAGNAATVRPPMDASAYGAAMYNFVGQVRARYPAALILLASSPMLSDFYPTAAEAQHTTQEAALNAVVMQLGDPMVKMVSFPTETVAPGQNGCDSHPSASQHRDMAAILTATLKANLTW